MPPFKVVVHVVGAREPQLARRALTLEVTQRRDEGERRSDRASRNDGEPDHGRPRNGAGYTDGAGWKIGRRTGVTRGFGWRRRYQGFDGWSGDEGDRVAWGDLSNSGFCGFCFFMEVNLSMLLEPRATFFADPQRVRAGGVDRGLLSLSASARGSPAESITPLSTPGHTDRETYMFH